MVCRILYSDLHRNALYPFVKNSCNILRNCFHATVGRRVGACFFPTILELQTTSHSYKTELLRRKQMYMMLPTFIYHYTKYTVVVVVVDKYNIVNTSIDAVS